MVKVFLSTLPFCVFGLAVNLLAVEIHTEPATAQAAKSELESAQAANPAKNALEPEILAEINRVRTNPQGYAQWLESQRQFYDGIWLKLPGEKPIRTNRGLKALEEAIAVLKDQPPLAPLNVSEQTAATATSKLEDFATANNIQNISYGRVTPEGIVMSIVVDELFPDRRRRKSLLSVEAEDTGVVCKPDPRYSKVCAIAYSDTAPSPNTQNDSAEVAEAKPETDSQSENEASNGTVDNQPEIARAKPETAPNSDSENNSSESDTTKTAASSQTPALPAESSPGKDNNEAENTAEDTVATSLPQPAQPQSPPSTPEVAVPSPKIDNEEVAESDIELETEEESEEPEDPELAEKPVENQQDEELEKPEELEPEESEDPELAEEPEELEESETESETESESELEPELEPELEEEPESESELELELDESAEAENEIEETEELEAEADNSEEVATNSDITSILDNEERGALEEGDRTIPEDGSFYDSYPIKAKSGDSITIYLESDEFDPFVALIDDQGNIVEQNDDISEEDSNSEIKVTIPQDGSYNVIVNAYDEGGKGEYVLTLSQ